MKIYLSGGMEFKTALGAEWRTFMTEELSKIGHIAIDPCMLEEDNNLSSPTQYHITQLKLDGRLDEVRSIVRNSLFRKDMWGIQMADAMLVLYDESVQKGAGTLAETWEAFREGRPVYLVTSFGLDRLPTWLIGETTELFANFEDFLEYAKDHARLQSDIEKMKKTRDETLGGLYTSSK